MRTYRVLLLASYCGDDNPDCTEDLPCDDCIRMCNIVEIHGQINANFGGLEYNRTKNKECGKNILKLSISNELFEI